tara:strand:- start:1502 stop:2422 length:921 start_codon:yes stop_codon:yes gene_type:complete
MEASAPSPAPAPIVFAENYNKYRFIIEKNTNVSEQINIELKINDTERYSYTIDESSHFWNTNKRYFQDDFSLFYKALNQTLKHKSGEFKYSITHLNSENINIELKYENGLLSFNIDIPLVKILSENEELFKQIKVLKQEISNIKHICGLDRSLKIKKVNEKDISNYCQYDFKKPPRNINPYNLVIINKTQYELDYIKKNEDRFPYNATIPMNKCACHTFDRKNLNCPSNGVVTHISTTVGYGPCQPGGRSHLNLDLNFNGTNHDIDKFFKMTISLSRIPDTMKIEHINCIEIDINKMDGFYVLTYE